MSRLSSDENIFKGDFYEAEQEADMHAFGAEDEDYYFQIAENLEDDRQFILIIYDLWIISGEPNLPNYWKAMEHAYRSRLLKPCSRRKAMKNW